MNPEEDADVGSAGTKDEFGKGHGSLSNNFEPGAENNADAGTINSNLFLNPSGQKEKINLTIISMATFQTQTLSTSNCSLKQAKTQKQWKPR